MEGKYFSIRAILGLTTTCLLVHARPAVAVPPQLVSARSPALAQPSGANASSGEPIMTPDGRFVLFTSSANNLAAGENNLLRSDVFLYDRLSNTTALVSVNRTNTGGGNGHSSGDCISANGRYIVFESDASDLVPNDTNGCTDIFVRDMLAGTTILISVATNGRSGNSRSLYPVMTPDGRYVAFLSLSSNLVFGDTNGIEDVFLRDTVSGTTALVSVGASNPPYGSSLPGGPFQMDTPAITPDGRYVAFFSYALGLAPSNTTYPADVYVHDMTAGTTTWISSNLTHYGPDGVPFCGSMYPFLSDDGNLVSFQYLSASSNYLQIFRYSASTQSNALVNSLAFEAFNSYHGFSASGMPQADIDSVGPRMTPDGRYVVYITSDANIRLWDGNTSNDIVVSVDLSNNPATGGLSDTPVVSPDRRFVTFLSTAKNLVTNPVVAGTHIYQRDLVLSNTTLVDVDPTGAGSVDVTSTSLSVSTNGQFVAFSAPDGSLTPDDTNLAFDVFLRDVVNDTTTRISAPAPGVVSASGNGISFMSQASLSTNGRWLVFTSAAEDLVPNDGNGLPDVFVRDLQTGTNILVSVGTNGLGGLGGFSGSPLISGDGRYVVFQSAAVNLAAGLANLPVGIFKRDLQMGTTKLVDVNSHGTTLGYGNSSAVCMSQDARYVAFLELTNATYRNVFWRDTVGNVTTVVTNPSYSVISLSLSLDGRYVAYSDTASHAFVWDSVTGTNVFSTNGAFSSMALSSTGAKLLYQSGANFNVLATSNGAPLFSVTGAAMVGSTAVWSANERFIAFATTAAVAPKDTNNASDIYLADLLSGSNTLVSSNITNLGSGNTASDWPTISADGRFVVFRSFATDLAPGVMNPPNVFVFDRLTGSNTLLSAESSPLPVWNSFVEHPAVSADGSIVAFQSTKAALVPGSLDLNRQPDIFAAQTPWGLTDSVGDGIPDAWRALYFGGDGTTTNSQSCASCDPDGDGMSNLAEYLAGTNPTNATSLLQLQLSASVASNNVTLNWPAASGRVYTVQYKVHLTDPAWLAPSGTPWVVGNVGNFTVPFSQTGGYYRVTAVY